MTSSERPLSDEPVVSARWKGRTIVWRAGVLTGDAEMVAAARSAAAAAAMVDLTTAGPKITASLDDPIGAAAALIASAPGRASLVHAPVQVWNLIDAAADAMIHSAGRGSHCKGFKS